MKTCPSCNRTYLDDSLSFCLEDGSPLLSAPVDPQATQRIPPPPGTDPNASTQIYTSQPSFQPAPPPFAQPPQYGAWSPPQPQKSGSKTWLIIVGVVVVLAIGAVMGLIVLGALVGKRSTRSYSTTSSTPGAADKLKGSWSGLQNGKTTTLWINDSSGNTFSGLKDQGDTEVAFEGTIDSATRAVTIRETKVVRGTPYSNGSGWSLGIEKGTLSYDGRSISGTGNDQYNPTTPYQWSYTKK